MTFFVNGPCIFIPSAATQQSFIRYATKNKNQESGKILHRHLVRVNGIIAVALIFLIIL